MKDWVQLEAKLVAGQESLARRGSLASRVASGRRVWSVRFVERLADGQAVQRSVYVGSDPLVVARVRTWLDTLRQETQAAKEVAALGQLASVIGLAIRACSGPRRRAGVGPGRLHRWSKKSSI